MNRAGIGREFTGDCTSCDAAKSMAIYAEGRDGVKWYECSVCNHIVKVRNGIIVAEGS